MTAGRPNDTFSAVMAAAPKTEGAAAKPLTVDIAGMLPAERGRFFYEGSLTTPPCSETVAWNVFWTPIEVAQADIDAFRAIFPMNARPLQSINRRALLQHP